MNFTERKSFTDSLLVMALLITVAATLRFAQDFFLPLVLAGLLSFLLSPLVRILERLRLGHAAAVLLTAGIAFVLIGLMSYLITTQLLELAVSVPKYRSNLIARVAALKTPGNNPLPQAIQTITDVAAALNKTEDPVSPAAGKGKIAPVQVEVIQEREGAVAMFTNVLWPVVGPLASTLLVVIIVIFMLMAGSDLRDRLIHLVGRSRLRVTTQALDEVSQRISGYLRAQLLVNACFGLAIGIGLYLIGIPNALFWGLLGMVLRFLPYIGSWLAGALPLALAVAIFDTWTQPLLVIGLFVVVDLFVANVVEPWLYGSTTEISPLAVVVSALFWTWLWGGVGLVLATPLTVCLVVAGKYLPDLAFLNLLMGDKPSITSVDRLYQRLLALNDEESASLVESLAREESAPAAFDEAVLPALRNIESDFREGHLSEAGRADACQILRQIIADLTEPLASFEPGGASVLCIPANHEGDELAALMLSQVLGESGVLAPVLFSKSLSATDLVEQIAERSPVIICISSLLPASTSAARALCNRLRARLPSTQLLVGLWQPENLEFTARCERLTKSGANQTCSTLRSAAAEVVEFINPSLGVVAPQT